VTDFAARLTVVCTNGGRHKRRRLAQFTLDPVIEGVPHYGLYLNAGVHPGERAPQGHGRYNLPCPSCPLDVDLRQDTVEALLDALVDEGRRASEVDVSSSASVL